MKKIIKKWWFWLIIVLIFLILFLIVNEIIEQQKVKKSIENIGNGIKSYTEELNNTNTHLNEFVYDEKKGQVTYSPTITLEKYNNIKEGMSEKEVISIIGDFDKKLDGENTYMLEWGSSYSPAYNGYWIQIVFDADGKVLNKYQTGL